MDQRYMALAIFTGMRRGEIIGLRWEDVDLSTNVLHVRRNVTYPKGDNRPCIGTPKTESGNLYKNNSCNLYRLHEFHVVPAIGFEPMTLRV